MIRSIDLNYIYVSTYLLVIFFSTLISFIIFYNMTKQKFDKIDIIYIFAINILGFALGSKIFYLLDTAQNFTIFNFTNGGFRFIGGILGSSLLVFLYCKKYKLNFFNMQSYFCIVYMLMYSINKWGCYLNGCCSCVYGIFPLQILESMLMFILFICLYRLLKNKGSYYCISMFLILFGIIRFVVDYFRYARDILLYNLTLSQLICIIFIIIGVIMFIRKRKAIE